MQSFNDRITSALRALFDSYGYSQYKMSKFEEYDLYARNKDFLISDSIITFTDTNGKLMALKPDVTLSIVKNTKDEPGAVRKLYYNENVYRVSKGTRAFREIMQVGLECIGDVDDYDISEVLLLAAESLRSVSQACILDISHLGIMSQLIDRIGVPEENKADLIKCIGEKNRHELARICRESGVAQGDIDALSRLVAISGSAGKTLAEITGLLKGYVDEEALSQFENIMTALIESPLSDVFHIDFSVVDDVHYYNGFVFKGFVESIPSSVLSGGQYDKLMQKMGRASGAIGFAVYMDALERLDRQTREYDVDVVLLYEAGAPLGKLQAAVKEMAENGKSVLTLRSIPGDIKCRQIMKMRDGEVEILEDNA